METLLRDEISPSATSRILANNILSSLEGQPPTFASRSFLEANCRAFRRIIWSVIVEDKQGLGQETIFEFKYIPNLSKITKAEKGRGTLTKRGGIEKRNLRAFLLGCIVIISVVWMATRLLIMAWLRATTLHQNTRSTLTPQHRENSTPIRANVGGNHHGRVSLVVEAVIGSTVSSINAVTAAVDINSFAFCAGSTVVLAVINSQLHLDQRLFRVKPDALPAQATPSYYNPATPLKATGTRNHTNTPSKDESALGNASFDNNADALGKAKASHRSKSLTSVTLSPSGKYLAVGEVCSSTTFRTAVCRHKS
ncbi:MAG: hypothetical protein Q9166_001364 [cf. Caloplaca sp. 2 TL-2023]